MGISTCNAIVCDVRDHFNARSNVYCDSLQTVAAVQK